MFSRASTQPLKKSSMPVVKRFVLQQVFGGQQLLAETADGHHRPDQRQRRDHGAHARAVGQAGVDDGRGIVDAAADVRNDAVDDHAHVRLVLEADVGLHQAPAALDVDVVVPVHQDVADGRILEQRLQRAQTEDLVEHLLDEPLALGDRHRDVPSSTISARQPRRSARARPPCDQGAKLIRRERVQQASVDLRFDRKPAVGAGGRPDGGSCSHRTFYVSAAMPLRAWKRASSGLLEFFAFPAVALSTKLRKARSNSPAASRSATKGPPLLIAAARGRTAGFRRTPAGSASAGSAPATRGSGRSSLGELVYHHPDLVLGEAQPHEERQYSAGHCGWRELLVVTRKTALRRLQRAEHHFVRHVAPRVDDDRLVLLHQERRELAEHRLGEIAAMLEASGGPTRKKPSGSRATKPSNSAWSIRDRFSPTSESVYCGEAPSCMATSLEVQSRSISTVCCLRCASTAAKLTASVVVPTPPFAPRNV